MTDRRETNDERERLARLISPWAWRGANVDSDAGEYDRGRAFEAADRILDAGYRHDPDAWRAVDVDESVYPDGVSDWDKAGRGYWDERYKEFVYLPKPEGSDNGR